MAESSVLRAYGDESIIRDNTTDRVIGFAFFVVNGDGEPLVERAIQQFKVDARVDPGVDLHCREMFRNLREGQTSPWAHLERHDLFLRLEQLCATVSQFTPPPIGCGGLLVDVPPSWKDDRSIFGGYHPKNLATVTYMNAALRVISDHPGIDLVIDEDKTKIPYGGKRQAHNTRGFFVGERDGQEPMQFVPKIARAPKPKALQLADLYAYALTHATDPQERWRESFQQLLRAGQFISVPFTRLEASPTWRTLGDRRDTVVDDLITLWVLVKDGRKMNVMWAPQNGAGHWVAAKYQDVEGEWLISLACDTYADAVTRADEFTEARLAEGWTREA